MSKNYDSQNRQVFERGLKLYMNTVIKPKLLLLLTRFAEVFVDFIDSIPDDSPIPIYTGNLKDSTGVGVYVDGAASVFIPTKSATRRQRTKEVQNIDGMNDLIYEVLASTNQFSEGIWYVVFSAVPYAWKVNESGSPIGRGEGFFDQIEEKATQIIRDGLRTEGIEFR